MSKSVCRCAGLCKGDCGKKEDCQTQLDVWSLRKQADGIHCVDCGHEVEKPFAAGSARCDSCWDDRCGGAGESEL